MITAKHQSGTRKNFTGKNELVAFLKGDKSPEMWTVDIDGFKCTGAEVVEYAGSHKTQTTDSKNTILAKLLKHRKSLLELLTNK